MSQRMTYPGGNNNLADAILLTRTQVFTNGGDRSFARNVAVIVVGGDPDINNARTIAEAQIAQGQFEIYAFGISGGVSAGLIQDLSSAPQALNTNYYMPNSYSDLRTYAGVLQNVICTRQQQGK